MTDTILDPTPYGAPDGADALPGVVALYEAYDTTRAARITDPTDENREAFRQAQAALSDARALWRGVREWAAAVAYDEWAKANPEAAARLEAGGAESSEEQA